MSKMARRIYVIKDSRDHYYRSCCDNFFTTAHSKVLVIDTESITQARKFHFLFWAKHRAGYLSRNTSRLYRVLEIPEDKPGPIYRAEDDQNN